MEHKILKSFNLTQDIEFIHYIRTALENGKGIFFYEAYDENKTECWGESEEDDCMTVFLSDKFTIQGLAIGFIHAYGEDLNLSIQYDEDNPIECEDGEVIYQKYLIMYLD